MHPLKFRTMFSTTLRCTFCSTIFPSHKIFNLKKPFSSSSPPSQQEALLHHQCWSGLDNWRSSPLNHSRFWGLNGPQAPILLEETRDSVDLCSCSSLAEMGAVVLSTADPLMKSKLSHLAFIRWFQEGLPIGVFQPPQKPARPLNPKLVSPKEIPSPKNLADDESRHFAWCLQRLNELGFSYGDMPAHNLLWRECDKTSDNVAARLAAIPLVQEARGLDAGPRLVKKLIGFGDHRTSNIVARIADEEVAHVAVGLYWFLSVCQKMGRDPSSAFKDLLKEYNVELKGPFNHSARDEVGIPREWYDPQISGEEEQQTKLSGVSSPKLDCRNSYSIMNNNFKIPWQVYDRLSYIVSMEQENSRLDRPQGYDRSGNELDK